MMQEGLPYGVPAAIIDKDGTSMSRDVTQQLAGLQLVDLKEDCNSFTEARHMMQEGKIFGYFLIPENFQQDLLSGKKPVISYYTNMTYYVPANLLFKSFTTTAVYTKAGVTMQVLESVGATSDQVTPLLMPVSIQARAIHNPTLNYGIYLCNSFLPGVLQLMILLVTCFSLGQEIKYGTSVRLLRMAHGSVFRAITAKLLPQTIVWIIIALFLESWLFGFNGYPVHGSWFWLTLSEIMFVLAVQGFGLFIFCLFPNLRLSLSLSALLGILSFSIAAFSFPVESMYPAMGVFSWIVPTRYNFLIYIDQALNGVDIYYSRIWFVAYIIFMVLPFTMLWHVKRCMARPVYAP
uniref:Membrane protein n=1 Tax=uncultured Muribaculaceae bacterium TaxID=2301481 RepID=A0A6G8F3Q1_9BACT|nr:membrane protein [uncultured Muribaculaceae bacterium]